MALFCRIYLLVFIWSGGYSDFVACGFLGPIFSVRDLLSAGGGYILFRDLSCERVISQFVAAVAVGDRRNLS